MSAALIQSVVSLPESPFPPLAVGFMGLGTGYMTFKTPTPMQAGSGGTGG